MTEPLPETPPAGSDIERLAQAALRHARRVVIAVIGVSALLLGTALLFLPGPGLAVLAFGVVVLAAEFAWARVWLRRVQAGIRYITLRARQKGEEQESGVAESPGTIRGD